MRTDNRASKNTVVSIYLILIVLAILFVTVFQAVNIFDGSTIYILLGTLLLLFLFHAVAFYFEYDSDGVKITVVNSGFILTDYINYRKKEVDFARHELEGFKIKNYIVYKSLYLFLKSRNNHSRKVRFNVSMVRQKKLRYVKQSLRKILKENKKEKQQG